LLILVPDIPAAVSVAVVHPGGDGSRTVIGRQLDPGCKREGLIEFEVADIGNFGDGGLGDLRSLSLLLTILLPFRGLRNGDFAWLAVDFDLRGGADSVERSEKVKPVRRDGIFKNIRGRCGQPLLK